MLRLNISDIAIIAVKNVVNITKSEAINLLENYVLQIRGYI